MQQSFKQEGLDRKTILKSKILALIPFGTFTFFLYHWLVFGDFFLFLKVERDWGRSFHLNMDHFLGVGRAAITNLSLDLFYLVFIICIIFALIRKKYFAYAIYVASVVFMAISSGTTMSIGRYILVLFPIFIVGASIKNELLRYFWIMISSFLMALNTLLFVNWYWAG